MGYSECSYLPGSYVLRYTQHANARSQQRGVQLSLTDVRKLENALRTTQQKKPFHRTAFFVNHLIFIVDVASQEIITVIDRYKTGNANAYISSIDSVVVVS